jgi:protein-histidine pros-kinase
MKLPGPLTAQQEHQLTTVQASARHLLALINDLLDLAKIRAGKVELNPEPLRLGDVVDEVVTALRPQAEARGLRLEAELPAEPVEVRADRRAVSQILLNLAGNAIKFTERGYVRLRIVARASDVSILVEDTGIGIREADQPHLFTAFARVGDGLARKAEGTGLGLHVSHHLAALLGGRLSVTSEFGKGSVFRLQFGRD